MKRIGIFGGTFNPPHIGHLIMANEVLFSLKLDEIWFMPSHIPPHKTLKQEIDPNHRLNMLSLATDGYSKFRVQSIEFERNDISYTFDTMCILKETYPDNQFYFIIGADMVEYLPKWYNIEELQKLVTFVGVKRPGYEMKSPYSILEVEAPQMDISSSFIRERVKVQGPIDFYVPLSVKHYIEENQLYESE
ncbi:nicotinate-nucleotide adenylyltransferase [Priestia flexa]|uniref:nicotinate-nucleotide adenylyltransferase n=1 Tax=Priestia flexa TaxID=86664 RepID=UPI0013D59593|nr:nicotinate-nucleotide adenylyltransferase [Priestia flexa]MCM3064869.1 nicotinate-nucleotide adenylyltransferase [Priestia flexa]